LTGKHICTYLPYALVLIWFLLHCSEFVGNVGGRGGILSIAYFPISFYGNVTFINSSGPAFRVGFIFTHIRIMYMYHYTVYIE